MNLAKIVSYTPWVAGVKFYEGFSAKPKADVDGSFIIGYGHTIKTSELDKYGNGITLLDAHKLLIADMTKVANQVVEALPKTDTCPHWLRAFTDMAYNCGPGCLKNTNLALAFLDQDYEAVPEIMKEWDHATIEGIKKVMPGLKLRREWDAQVYLYGDYQVVS